ncbi:hypothetical protein [Streptomyces sp. NPDC002855]|uniref:hypothetical protein n=1 Tax=Streptomyces sp. NPDC002855 TaxID=3154437 RepID=UPI00331BD854
MPDQLPVEEAAPALQRLLSEESTQDPLAAALRSFVNFAQIDFAVPDAPESDGCLFEYGVTSFTGEPRFTVNLTRQFETLDSSGEHESYTQVSCEVQYQVTREIESLGECEEWWFRGSQGPDFASWWQSLPLEPLARVLDDYAPTAVVVDSDVA